jgi:PKD repeat protein
VANPTVTGSSSRASSSAASLQLAPFAVASGGCVIVFSVFGSVQSVTDNRGNHYSQVAAGPSSNLVAYLALIPVGSPNLVVTVRYVAAIAVAAAAVGIQSNAGSPLDAFTSGSSGNMPPASDTITTNVANDLILEAVAVQSSVMLTPSGGSTIVTQVQQVLANFSFGVASQQAGGPNPYTTSAGFAGNISWIALSVAIAPAAAPPPLTASASGVPVAGPAPLAVAFTGAGAGGTPPYSFGWTFGDGGVSALQNPSHTYTAVGSPTATLTVTDSVPNTAQATVPITVTPSGGGTTATRGAVGGRIRPTTQQGASSRKIRLL